MRNIYQAKLESFYSQNKRMPTYSEMTRLFNFKSKNAVFRVVEKLTEAGLVAKDHLGRLIPSKIFGEVPKLGLPACQKQRAHLYAGGRWRLHDRCSHRKG